MALAAAVLVACGCDIKGKLRQAAVPSGPVTVTVISVSTEGGQGGPSYVGTVSASRTTTLTSPAPGTLETLSVREGSTVSKGQVLGKISSQTVESAYSAAKAQLDQAQDGLRRVTAVYESGAVAEVEYIAIKAKVEEAKAAEAAARDTRDRCTLRAPFAGVVDKVWPVQGTDLTLAQPVLSVIDLSSLEVRFSIPEAEYHLYREGTPATVEIPALAQSVRGKITSKGLVASALSRSYECAVSLPASQVQGLMPGMVCKVRLQAEGESLPVIPASAVMTDTRGRYVWTATDDVVDKRYVTLGGFSGDGVIVTEGIDQGDLVIVEGARKVSTGMKVKTVLR